MGNRLFQARHTTVTVLTGLAAGLALTTAWAATSGRLGALGSMLLPMPVAPPASHAPSPAPTARQPAATAPSFTGGSEAADPEGRLYGVAHQAHFVTRDPAQALRAWDAYLQAYPAGRFALEARYNRALTLVRLGQLDEARTALTPFANGETGGYRQREARELLDAMQ